MNISMPQVAIIGAGPYGLAAAAHLRTANVETRIFGAAMEFWERQMPAGMSLRSEWYTSHIADPRGVLTLDHYQASQNTQLPTPLLLDNFIKYGRWFQRHVVPDLDRRRVDRVEPSSEGFRLVLEDGESVYMDRVVVATGIGLFAWCPPQFDAVPPELASHSSAHSDLRRFTGQQVIVVGGGQSAFESAALLYDAGADVEVIMRASQIRWLIKDGRVRGNLPDLVREPIRKLLYPVDIGPLGLNWLVAIPGLFRRLPAPLYDRIAYRCVRPAVASWVRPRLDEVRITTNRSVRAAAPVGKQLKLTLDDGTERCVDHVLLATGYRIDISHYPFLSPEIIRAVRRPDGYPKMGDGFETSVPGLHFLGAPAAKTFGPLVRFVAGTGYTARQLTRHILTNSTVPTNRRLTYHYD